MVPIEQSCAVFGCQIDQNKEKSDSKLDIADTVVGVWDGGDGTHDVAISHVEGGMNINVIASEGWPACKFFFFAKFLYL